MSNHLTLTGNVVRDPELRFSASGTPRAVIPVATNRRFQAKGSDQPTEVTSFFTVIVWGQLAEHVSESLAKGDRVTVSGRVEQRSWVDEAQQRHSSFEIVADDVAASLRFRPVRIDRTVRSAPGRDESASVTAPESPDAVMSSGMDHEPAGSEDPTASPFVATFGASTESDDPFETYAVAS